MQPVQELHMVNKVLTAIIVTFLVLGSLILCLANPSRELLAALLFELTMLTALAVYRFFRARRKDSQARDVIVKTLESQWRLLSIARRTGVVLKTLFLLAASVIVSCEISGMALAFSGHLSAAESVYETMPTLRMFGMHPAYSMEIMTGAYVAAGRYEAAERFYPTILAIRCHLYGENHEYYPGFYADLADLRLKERRLPESEALFRYSLALSSKIFHDTTGGSVMTKLGDLLRLEHKDVQSEEMYRAALAMRTRQFGPKSLKVCETLDHYRQLLVAQGRSTEAQAMEGREKEILKRESTGIAVSSYFPVAILVVSFMGSYLLFGRKGYLTNFAIDRLSRSADKNGSASEDLNLLIRYSRERESR